MLRLICFFRQVFGSDYRIAGLMASTHFSDFVLKPLLKKELLHWAKSRNEMFKLPIRINAQSMQLVSKSLTGDVCSILYQMLLYHGLYQHRGDIVRYYRICN